MPRYLIKSGYVPESVDERFNAQDSSKMALGWLLLVGRPADFSINPVPFKKIGVVPLGVEHSVGFRGPNSPEKAVIFVGAIALRGNIFQVKGEHYRSGRASGYLSAQEASFSDTERYSGLLLAEEALLHDEAAVDVKRPSRLEVVEQAFKDMNSDLGFVEI